MGLFKIFRQTPHASKTSESTSEAKSLRQEPSKEGVFRSSAKDSQSGSIKTIPYTSVSAQSPRSASYHSSVNRAASSSFIPDPARATYRATRTPSGATPSVKAQSNLSVDRSWDHPEAKQRELRAPDASKPLPNQPTSPVLAGRGSGAETDAGQRRSLFTLRGFSSKLESSANRVSEHDFTGKPSSPHTRVDNQEHLGQLRSSVSMANVATAAENASPRRSHRRHNSGASLPSSLDQTIIPSIYSIGPDKNEGKLHISNVPMPSLRHTPNVNDNCNSSASFLQRDARQDTFEVRSFRHVSGSGAGSDGVREDSPAARTPQTTTLLDLQPSTRADPTHEPRTVSMPRLSRPPSFAGSIGGEEPARQVSVQMFKQTRRLSTSSVFTLEAYQYADADIDDTPPSTEVKQNVSPERLRRTSTRGSAIEMLSSPPRKPLEPLDNCNRFTQSANATSSRVQAQSVNSGQEQEHGAPLLEMMADVCMGDSRMGIPTSRRLPRPGNNQRRAFSVVGDLTDQQVESSRTPPISIGFRSRHPVTNHDRSQSTTALPSIAVMTRETSDPRERIPLNQRLTNAASITPAAVPPPDVLGCLIPPVEAGTPRSVHVDVASPIVSTTHRSREISKPRVSSRTTSRSGWDSTSSEDEISPKIPRPKQQPKVHQSPSTKNPSVTNRSLPSGLRRPPAPSEAFGRDKWREPLDSSEVNPDRRVAATSSPTRPKVSTTKNRHTSTQSLVSETESESSSSSSDESLAMIKRKQSKNSLSSKVSYSTPSLASPGRGSSGTEPRERSPLKLKSSSRLLPKRSTETRALPTPSIFAMAGLSTSSWPYESPASSQSGTTGENSSRAGPITPQDASPQVRPMFLDEIPKGHEIRAADARPRSVSFHQPDSSEHSSPTSTHRNSRRKAEMKAGIELGCLVNGGGDGMFTADGIPQKQPLTSYKNIQDPHRAQYEQMVHMQMQMQMQMQMHLHQMQAAQMMPGYLSMHQQAMAAAKQQYQAAMAAAAIQAADEAWERASTAGGPGYPHASADDSFSGASFGGFPAVTPSSFGGSVYDNYAESSTSNRNRYASSASVYGESFGPPIHARPPSKLNIRASTSVRPETTLQYDRPSHRRAQSGSSFTLPLPSQATVPPSSWKTPTAPRILHDNHNDPTNS